MSFVFVVAVKMQTDRHSRSLKIHSTPEVALKWFWEPTFDQPQDLSSVVARRRDVDLKDAQLITVDTERFVTCV